MFSFYLMLAKCLIVESGNHGFSGSGSSYNQITEIATFFTFYFQFIQNLFLMGKQRIALIRKIAFLFQRIAV